MINKYYDIFKISIKSDFQYKYAILIQMLFEFIPLIGYLLLWKYMFMHHDIIGGMNQGQMVTYYLISRFLISVNTPQFQWEMNEDIRQGSIVTFLLRPISYIKYRFTVNLASSFTRLVIIIIPMIVMAISLNNYIVIPSIVTISQFILFSFISIVISFLLFYIMMLFAFFITEVASLSYTLELIIQFLSGSLLPLSIFPEGIQKFISYTPFPYITYFPISIFINKIKFDEILKALSVCTFWILVLLVCSYFIWNKGLRRFDGNGS